MRCAILGDVARSTAALDVAPKSGVYTLVNQGGGTTFGNANESDDIEWRQCVFMGSSKAVFGHRAGRSDDIRIDGCVSAQNFGDFIQFVGEGQTDNWTIKDTYAMAKGRASAADHRDFIQFEKVLTPHSHANWSIEGNWIQSRDAWGDDRYLAKQGLWGNANLGAMKDTAVDNLFAIPGKAMQGHWKDVTFEFNTIIPPIDSLGADSNDQNGVRPNTWDPAFIVPANDDATLAADENIIVSHANGFDNGFAGPNGLVIWQNGFWQFSHANKGPPDWSLLGKYLENYSRRSDKTRERGLHQQRHRSEQRQVPTFAPRVLGCRRSARRRCRAVQAQGRYTDALGRPRPHRLLQALRARVRHHEPRQPHGLGLANGRRLPHLLRSQQRRGRGIG